MPNAVFVAPYFLETTLRFVAAVAETSGVRLGLASVDPPEKLPPALRAKLTAHVPVSPALDPEAIAGAVRRLGNHLGDIHRLIGTLEELQVPLAEVRAELGIPGMGVEAAKNFRDKARMKQVLREAGLPCARHRLARDPAEALAFAAEIGFPLVVKPPAGSGARQTFRVDGPEDLRACLAALPPSEAQPALVEEFVVGEEHSFDSVFVRGRPVWYSVTHYSPTPLEVLRNPWIQWCVMIPRETGIPAYHAIRAAGVRALEALGMESGLSHMEWFRRPDGSIAISEVAARPPGAQFTTLMSAAHEVDMYRAWARLMVHDDFTPPARPYAAGAAFLRGQGSGRVKAIHGLEEAGREIGSLIYEVKLPRLDQAPGGGYEGEGYVLVRHPETAVVERALRTLITTIRVELG